jgi:cytochrome c-type biogenesis protein CcmH/NrfG
MITLYGLFFLMLVCAIGLLAIPYVKTQTLFSRGFFSAALFTLILAIGLFFAGNHAGLKEWLTRGKEHYQLQNQMNQLGGFAGIVARIKEKLAQNPDDAKGWLILGKLYLANENYHDAIDALSKAHKLQPTDLEIKHFYELALAHRK